MANLLDFLLHRMKTNPTMMILTVNITSATMKNIILPLLDPVGSGEARICRGVEDGNKVENEVIEMREEISAMDESFTEEKERWTTEVIGAIGQVLG